MSKILWIQKLLDKLYPICVKFMDAWTKARKFRGKL
jgi:hypothetical protein